MKKPDLIDKDGMMWFSNPSIFMFPTNPEDISVTQIKSALKVYKVDPDLIREIERRLLNNNT